MARMIKPFTTGVTMFASKYLFIVATLFGASAVRAEVIECKGAANTSPPTKIEVSVDMDKGKSSLRWVYPDGTGITQGQSINRRKFDGANVKYMDQGSSRVFLQIPAATTTTAQGAFTHAPQGLNAVPVDCEVFGSIPAAPVCPKDKDRALLSAMDTAETVEQIEFLLQCGANPNTTNSKSCTPLMLAVDPDCHPGSASGMITDTVALVDLFLSNGAFIDTQDRKGETALIKSARNGMSNVYSSFIASEASFDHQDKKGNTALMYAALEGDKWIIQDILEGNPDRRLKNKSGKTAFDLAKHWHDKETADLVRIPDQTVTISGKSDGTCAPLAIEVKQGQAIEFVLNATDKMFKLDAKGLGLSLMADRGSFAKQILTMENRGNYKFTCGFHGANTASEGVISVR